MIVRRLEPSDVALVASIDRSERVEVQYRIENGRLVEAPVSTAEILPWDPDGSGDHSVAGHIAFCSSVIADGGLLFGAFDESGGLMGLATVHPTFEPGLAWLATLHVSRAHRRRGVASALWDASTAVALDAGAAFLYVSATPTGSAVGFYLGRGCRLADPVHEDLFAAEPEDIHLVYPLGGGNALPGGHDLRELRREDAPALHALKLRNRDRLTRYGDWTIPEDYTVADAEAELDGGEHPKRSFGIWHREHLVGVVSLTAVTERSWAIGYFLDAESTGRGVASAACKAVLPAARQGGASEIYGVVTKGNASSDAVLERAGFHVLQMTPRSTRWWLPLAPGSVVPTMQLFAARRAEWTDKTGGAQTLDVVAVDFDHEVIDDVLHPSLGAEGTVRSALPTYYLRLEDAGAPLTPCHVRSPGHPDLDAAIAAAEKAVAAPITWTSSA